MEDDDDHVLGCGGLGERGVKLNRVGEGLSGSLGVPESRTSAGRVRGSLLRKFRGQLTYALKFEVGPSAVEQAFIRCLKEEADIFGEILIALRSLGPGSKKAGSLRAGQT